MTRKTKLPDTAAAAYKRASGGTVRIASPSVSIKSQIYGSGKPLAPVMSRSGAPAQEGYPTVNPVVGASVSAPINNMGENLVSDESEMGEVNLVITDSGKIKTLMVRKPAQGELCIVDWVNFTVLEDTWFKTARQVLVSDDQIIEEASRYLEKIFGFGITDKRQNGMNFYRESWVLGDEMGFVCFGGQRETMLITLTGQGCNYALSGWEKRLHDFLTTVAVRPSISRIDLAHDDFDGAYLSVDWAEQQWHVGGYQMAKGGRAPSIERIGNWHRPSGRGRTLTIGLRTSGKFTRFYEKGKKEGDKLSSWCRVEVEYKNSDRIITPGVLLSPSDFFSASYPCFDTFAHIKTPKRFSLKQKTAQINIEDSLAVTKHQFGKYLRVFRDLYGDKETLDLVCNPDSTKWPKRLKPLTASIDSGAVAIHLREKAFVPDPFRFYTATSQFGLGGDNGFLQAHH